MYIHNKVRLEKRFLSWVVREDADTGTTMTTEMTLHGVVLLGVCWGGREGGREGGGGGGGGGGQ